MKNRKNVMFGYFSNFTVPIGAPVVTLIPTSSTSLKVEWTKLTPQQARGIIVKYRVIYREYGRASQQVELVNGGIREFTLTGIWWCTNCTKVSFCTSVNQLKYLSLSL